DERAELVGETGIAPHVPTPRERIDRGARHVVATRHGPFRALPAVLILGGVPEDALRGIAQRRPPGGGAVARRAHRDRNLDLEASRRATAARGTGGDAREIVGPARRAEEQ